MDTCLVFAGDYIDRGDHSLELYQYLSEVASQMALKTGDRERVIRVMGNHELAILQNNTQYANWNSCQVTFLTAETPLPDDPAKYPVIRKEGSEYALYAESKDPATRKSCEEKRYLGPTSLSNTTERLLQTNIVRPCEKLNSSFQTKLFSRELQQFRERLLFDIQEKHLVSAYHFKAKNNKGIEQSMVVTHAGITQALCDEYKKGPPPRDSIDPEAMVKWLNDSVRAEKTLEAFEISAANNNRSRQKILFRGKGGNEGDNGIFWNRALARCNDVSFGQIKGHDVVKVEEIAKDAGAEQERPIFYLDVGASEGYQKIYNEPRAYWQLSTKAPPMAMKEGIAKIALVPPKLLSRLPRPCPPSLKQALDLLQQGNGLTNQCPSK
ncbi:MAG: metallophosphoesterase [Oligoflexia bacterium]|nr:metallophosphoesterase [Oligoflexia bacterium]